MLKHEHGATIDGHDVIIRLKRSKALTERPRIYGSGTDIVMGSMIIAPLMVREWDVPEYWFFLDTRTQTLCNQSIQAFKREVPVKCLIDRELCLDLIGEYRGLREAFRLDGRQERKDADSNAGHVNLSDDNGHLHPSAGMFAIAYALRHLRPDVLNLYGFDNIRTGSFDWSVTRGPEWGKYPDHNWKAESLLLRRLAGNNGYTIKDAEIVSLCK